ncbi:hypothetical protein SLEP1_g25128 [Rubroshorea leprosula]|uniref:Uncharacterized protein n=1 Tax=Rubroshorea leprosula TaxID=152421 RepID=A0AAV5JN91_9ROSI|nr:hypothetical protein SLEP1_g25128 [Rubroshorea leprosula]
MKAKQVRPFPFTVQSKFSLSCLWCGLTTPPIDRGWIRAGNNLWEFLSSGGD